MTYEEYKTARMVRFIGDLVKNGRVFCINHNIYKKHYEWLPCTENIDEVDQNMAMKRVTIQTDDVGNKYDYRYYDALFKSFDLTIKHWLDICSTYIPLDKSRSKQMTNPDPFDIEGLNWKQYKKDSNRVNKIENILNTFQSIEVSYECNCCYMTTGEHSSSCPKYQTP